jgi:phosphoglycerate dehydrogenase-like enzyme
VNLYWLLLLKVMSISDANISEFVTALATACSCINATLSCAPVFEEDIQRFDNLQCVVVRNFVGLGAVRYARDMSQQIHASDCPTTNTVQYAMQIHAIVLARQRAVG